MAGYQDAAIQPLAMPGPLVDSGPTHARPCRVQTLSIGKLSQIYNAISEAAQTGLARSHPLGKGGRAATKCRVVLAPLGQAWHRKDSEGNIKINNDTSGAAGTLAGMGPHEGTIRLSCLVPHAV